MLRKTILYTFILLSSLAAQAQEFPFKVSSIRTLTENVDRYYDNQNSAIATVICRTDAQQVMIVDARMPTLDGKTFYFLDYATCTESRNAAKAALNKCHVSVVVNAQSLGVKIQIDKCQ